MLSAKQIDRKAKAKERRALAAGHRRQMLTVRKALRMNRTRFAIFLGISGELLAAREAGRTTWQGNPLTDYGRRIQAEISKLDADLDQAKALFAADSKTARAVFPLSPPQTSASV